jgi:hypothetical protein
MIAKRGVHSVLIVLVMLIAFGVLPMSASAWTGPAATVNAPAGLHMRSAPSLAACIVRTLYNGQTVYIQAGPSWNAGISWSLVRVYHGGYYSEGWCASAYLSPYGGYVPGGHGLKVTAGLGLRLRSGPGTWYAICRTVPYGAILQPTGASQWGSGILWRQVVADGVYLWAASAYLMSV